MPAYQWDAVRARCLVAGTHSQLTAHVGSYALTEAEAEADFGGVRLIHSDISCFGAPAKIKIELHDVFVILMFGKRFQMAT